MPPKRPRNNDAMASFARALSGVQNMLAGTGTKKPKTSTGTTKRKLPNTLANATANATAATLRRQNLNTTRVSPVRQRTPAKKKQKASSPSPSSSPVKTKRKATVTPAKAPQVKTVEALLVQHKERQEGGG